jgi:hypothetical protein
LFEPLHELSAYPEYHPDHFYRQVLADPEINSVALANELFRDGTRNSTEKPLAVCSEAEIIDLAPPSLVSPPSNADVVDLLWPERAFKVRRARVGRFVISRRPAGRRISLPRRSSSVQPEAGELEM